IVADAGIVVVGKVEVNGTLVVNASSSVITIGDNDLTVFDFSGPPPSINSSNLFVYLGSLDPCLVAGMPEGKTIGMTYLVRVTVTRKTTDECLTTTASTATTLPANNNQVPPSPFPVLPVAVGAGVGGCLLITLIVAIVLCRRRKRGAAD